MKEFKSDFRTELEKIKNEYDAERKGFNIFRALHKEHDEKHLHSRFISYLLSPASSHGMGYAFLEAFINVIKNNCNEKFNFDLSNCQVTPNEENKSEYENIDILIENDNQAIVIENKIFADDSIHDVNEEEKEPIEILTHKNDNYIHNTPKVLKYHQLDTYCKTMENGTEMKQKKVDVIAIYLTPYEREPRITIKHKPLIMIHYHKEIIDWINKCIAIINERKDLTNHNKFMIKILNQYISVVRSFTSNLERVKRIKGLLNDNENIKEAWEIKDYILEKRKKENGKETNQIKWEDIKHVQWHTIDEFWRELADKLENSSNVKRIKDRITIEEITGIVHKNKKNSYGISFLLENGEEWYIVNDDINGLSYGNKTNNYWNYIDKEIKFTDFNNEKTFMLINKKNREDFIEDITKALIEKINMSK